MFVYLIRRFLLLIPTLFGITLITFVLINLAPGSPIEEKIRSLRFGGGGESAAASGGSSSGLTSDIVEEMKRQYGFDKPILVRYFLWLKNILSFDFGESYSYEEPAIDVIASKLPVSLQFGVLSFLLSYLICIPLGVWQAVKAGGLFDRLTVVILNFTYSIPPLVLGIYLIVYFAGRLDWFPLGGLQSENFSDFSTWEKILDRAHHFVLPTLCYMIGGFAELTSLMRNSMLDVIKSDYVRTARAKGLSEHLVYFKHALRNALIPIATGISGFMGIFLAGSLIVESMFNLDGIGLLGYKSVLSRDYNVIMALTFISSLVLVLERIVSDIIYVWVDPRIDFQ